MLSVIVQTISCREAPRGMAAGASGRCDGNNIGLSGSKAQRQEIFDAENSHGKQSTKYLREVTVGGGLPGIRTLRSLQDSEETKFSALTGFSLSASLIYNHVPNLAST